MERLGQDRFMSEGYTVYESLVERSRLKSLDGMAERFSVGGEVSLADVFLVPAVRGGLRVGVELERGPLVKGVVEECWKVKSFRKGGWGCMGGWCRSWDGGKRELFLTHYQH